jgi:hypothetical protein
VRKLKEIEAGQQDPRRQSGSSHPTTTIPSPLVAVPTKQKLSSVHPSSDPPPDTIYKDYLEKLEREIYSEDTSKPNTIPITDSRAHSQTARDGSPHKADSPSTFRCIRKSHSSSANNAPQPTCTRLHSYSISEMIMAPSQPHSCVKNVANVSIPEAHTTIIAFNTRTQHTFVSSQIVHRLSRTHYICGTIWPSTATTLCHATSKVVQQLFTLRTTSICT